MKDLTLLRVWTKEGVSIAEIVKTSGATEFMLGYGRSTLPLVLAR